MKALKGKKGFTLIEVIVILAVIAILAAVLTPMIIGYISDARVRAAESDVKTMAAAVQAFNKDMKDWPIWASGTAMKPTDAKYDVLQSAAGEEPDLAANTVTIPVKWDFINDQLLSNLPAYPVIATKIRKWAGPYLESVKADPWGNKYYIDVVGLQPDNIGDVTKVAYVISAGPNKLLETPFGPTGPSLTSVGDDILFRIK